MPSRIQICHPCALGECAKCLAPDVGDDGCVCRHSKAPRAVLRSAPALPDDASPSARDFDLTTALADARDAGRAAGYDEGYLAGVADGHGRAREELQMLAKEAGPPPLVVSLQARVAELEQALERAGSEAHGLAPAAPLVLVELDPNGGLVSVVDAGSLDALAEAAASYEPPLPGAYVEAWPVGGTEPVVLPVAR